MSSIKNILQALQFLHQKQQACDYTVQSSLSEVFSAESRFFGGI